jgi:hypothetical protein
MLRCANLSPDERKIMRDYSQTSEEVTRSMSPAIPADVQRMLDVLIPDSTLLPLPFRICLKSSSFRTSPR